MQQVTQFMAQHPVRVQLIEPATAVDVQVHGIATAAHDLTPRDGIGARPERDDEHLRVGYREAAVQACDGLRAGVDPGLQHGNGWRARTAEDAEPYVRTLNIDNGVRERAERDITVPVVWPILQQEYAPVRRRSEFVPGRRDVDRSGQIETESGVEPALLPRRTQQDPVEREHDGVAVPVHVGATIVRPGARQRDGIVDAGDRFARQADRIGRDPEGGFATVSGDRRDAGDGVVWCGRNRQRRARRR